MVTASSSDVTIASMPNLIKEIYMKKNIDMLYINRKGKKTYIPTFCIFSDTKLLRDLTSYRPIQINFEQSGLLVQIINNSNE